MYKLLCCCLIFFSALKVNNGARILGIVFTPSYSHQVAFWPIWKELSTRGHQVTVLTTNPIKNMSLTNLTEIDLSDSYTIMNNVTDFLSTNKRNMVEMLNIYCTALSDIADEQLGHPEVRRIIKLKPKFDLLMTEVMFPTHLAFAHHLNVPFIGLTSLDSLPRIHDAIGNPTNPVLYPDAMLPFVPPLQFRERVISSLLYVFMSWYAHYKLYPGEDLIVKKHFGESVPPLLDIQKNMSMLFRNVNPVFHGIRPVGPNTIDIGGGTHLNKLKALPSEIQEFLDNAPDGVIYFSLGTNVKSKNLNEQTRNILLESFKQMPYKVLWKFEDENLPNKPKNVKILKWIPQQDVLRHKNVKLFITQGGIQSIEEAMYNNVPMLAMPFFGDQINNAKIIEKKELGLQMHHSTLTIEEFVKNIDEIINNPKYRNNVKKLAELSRDVHVSGLDRAIWWTEYVLRHKGASHLRNPAADIPLYQFYLLDVLGFLLLALLVILFLLYLLVKIPICVIKCLMKYFRKEKKE